jgi:hypothetical protein
VLHRPRSPDAERQRNERRRRHRHRAKQGRRILRVEVEYFPLVEALIRSTRLSEAAALDPQQVEAAIGDVVREWCERWLKE